jgi:ketosteroid isomerase-like protein
VTREESRAVVRRPYDGVISTGHAEDAGMVAENDRVASRSAWDGTLTGSGQPVDFTTLDFFRIQDGLIAEHWESVDWVRAYQSFGLLSEEVDDA